MGSIITNNEENLVWDEGGEREIQLAQQDHYGAKPAHEYSK